VTDSAGFNGRLNVLWKRAAFESGSYTFAHSSASSQGLLIAVSGAVTSGSPIDASTPNTGAGTTTTALSVTTTSANDLLFYIAHDWEGTGGLSPPTGFTERFDSLIYAADARRRRMRIPPVHHGPRGSSHSKRPRVLPTRPFLRRSTHSRRRGRDSYRKRCCCQTTRAFDLQRRGDSESAGASCGDARRHRRVGHRNGAGTLGSLMATASMVHFIQNRSEPAALLI
jgi:hypothetical protein